MPRSSRSAPVAERPTAPTGGLVVDGVSRWGVGPVDFTAEPGTFVVITGKAGTGKSAIVGVIAGFDKPDVGQVRLNGIDIYDAAQSYLERQIGWLGAVIPAPGRTKRPLPALLVGDDTDQPFAVEQNLFGGLAELTGPSHLDGRWAPLLATIRYPCDQGAVVVIGTTRRQLVAAADQVVGL